MGTTTSIGEHMSNLLITIFRMSDNAKFEAGALLDWQIEKDGLIGFGEFTNVLGFTDSANSDGGEIDSEHVSKKDRTIKMVYRPSHGHDLARHNALAFFTAKDQYKVCVQWGVNDVYAIGKIEKLSCPEKHLGHGALKLTITFLFAKPYWSSRDDFGKNIAALRPLAGFPYMCSKTPGTVQGRTGGVFNYSQVVTLKNGGDTDTYCKISIRATDEVINPKIIINGKYVRVVDTMQRNDVIDMDFVAQPPRITKNGLNYVGHCDRTSAFTEMVLKRGDNAIQYDADNGTNHMNVTVFYNKQYGAI